MKLKWKYKFTILLKWAKRNDTTNPQFENHFPKIHQKRTVQQFPVCHMFHDCLFSLIVNKWDMTFSTAYFISVIIYNLDGKVCLSKLHCARGNALVTQWTNLFKHPYGKLVTVFCDSFPQIFFFLFNYVFLKLIHILHCTVTGYGPDIFSWHRNASVSNRDQQGDSFQPCAVPIS